VKRALPALVLVASACSSAVSGTAKPLTGNLAVVNGPGTAAALDAVKTASEAVFSYDSANPAAFDQAVAANVTGTAKQQLTTLFDAARKSPQPVHLTTRVVRNAAIELTGDRIR
jgi:Mce-associated membrane protein